MTFSLESHRERLKNIKGRKSSEEKEPKAGKYKECASALKTEEKEENARLIFDRQAGRLSHRRFWQTFSPAVIPTFGLYAFPSNLIGRIISVSRFRRKGNRYGLLSSFSIGWVSSKIFSFSNHMWPKVHAGGP